MKKKILLAVLVVVLLLGAGFAFVYFGTDTFKSEKEMFFTYITDSKSSDTVNVSKNLKKFLDKQQKNSYTNKGEITFNVTGIEDAETLNNTKLTFEGKTNNAQKLLEQKATLDLGVGINVPIALKIDNDTYGIQTDLLSSKYIAIRNSGLKALAEKFDIDSSKLPDKIDFEKKEFTKEEIKTLKDKYYTLIYENIEEDLFTKTKSENQTIVTLSITQEKLVQIIEKLVEEIKNDEIIKNKILDEIDINEYSESINEIITEMKESANENSKLEIKLYVENRNLKKMDILIYEEDQIIASILSEQTDDGVTVKAYDGRKLILQFAVTQKQEGKDVSCDIKLDAYGEENVSINITLTYKNLLELDNVETIFEIDLKMDNQNDTETYSMGTAEKSEIKAKLTNTITFNKDVQIENLNSENAIIINDATDEEMQELFKIINSKYNLI